MATKSPSIGKVFNLTTQALKNNPLLFTPFIIFSIFDALALIFIYLIPRQPLVTVLGPIVKTFWGERFLHYPLNFFLLPKLASHSRIVLSVLLGSLSTGMAIAIVFDIYQKKALKLSRSLKSAFKKYVSLFIIILILTIAYYFLVKFSTIIIAKYFIAGHRRLLFLPAKFWLGPILLGINFCLAILVQSAFIYAIPKVMIENINLIKAIGGAFLMFFRFFIPTLILVGLPMLIYVPILVLNYNLAFLILNLFPESVLLLCFLSIIISSLIIDPLITTASTFFYLASKE